MSKRITLTNFEIEQLICGLKALRNATNLDYEVVKVGKRFYTELIKKLELPNTSDKAEVSRAGIGEKG